jgi:hypothetical protein
VKDWRDWADDRRAFLALVTDVKARTRFAGMSHPELLRAQVSPAAQLVEELIEAGTPGSLAGLPETYKSFSGMQRPTARPS